MSTKIYFGFQLSASSLQEVLDTVKAFRPWVLARSQTLLNDFIKTSAGGDVNEGWRRWDELRRTTVKQGMRMPLVDTEFSLTFFPDGDRFLGIAYTEHQHWFEQWLAQPGVSEYAYWNNTDRPRHVTEADWQLRKESWDRVLGAQIVCMAGFSIEVAPPQGPYPE